jgi:hypothetical protein
VIAVTKGAMSDIKSNTFVGITAMPQPDGTQKAVEVHVFEESLRGTGEGHYPWDLMPNSTMTNGAVAQQVQKVEGNTLQVKYKDGEKTIVVPRDTACAVGDQRARAGTGRSASRFLPVVAARPAGRSAERGMFTEKPWEALQTGGHLDHV